MRRIGAVILFLLVLGAGPAAFAQDCVSEGGGPAGGGVVLGPATKCAKDGSASLPPSDGDSVDKVGATDDDAVPWGTIGAAVGAILVGGVVVRRAITRRAERLAA